MTRIRFGACRHVQEYEAPPHYLAPNHRKRFEELAQTWGVTISRQIEPHLPKKDEAA
jgi:hypothetical protein